MIFPSSKTDYRGNKGSYLDLVLRRLSWHLSQVALLPRCGEVCKVEQEHMQEMRRSNFDCKPVEGGHFSE